MRLPAIMRRWRADALYEGCLTLAGALLVALCALVGYGILARLFGWYAGGASDIAGYVMAAATFLALAPTFRACGHIYVSLIVGRLPPAWGRRASVATHAIMFFVAAYLAVYLCRLVYFSYVFGERSEGADALLLWPVQAPVAMGALIFAAAVLQCGIEVWLGRRPPQCAESDLSAATPAPPRQDRRG